MEVLLKDAGIGFFNPVVKEWDEEAKKRELREREECDFCLYCITPKMAGSYSIAEVVDDSNNRPRKTILVLLGNDGDDFFTDAQLNSLGAVAEMVKRNGGLVFYSLRDAVIGMHHSSFLSSPRLEGAVSEISNKVYNASEIFERLEHEGRIIGNGHHMAQKVAMFAEKLMRDRYGNPVR
jgi:hypothetical protein